MVHRGRALPLAWRVLAHPSASVSFDAYKLLLRQASNCLPPGVKVILLADRGFIHTEAMSFVQEQLGWHYRIRLKSNTWIWRVGRGWHQLNEFHLNRGEALCFHNIKLHKGQWFGPIHIIFDAMISMVSSGLLLVMSQRRSRALKNMACASILRRAFLDDQSNGWNLQKSDLRSVCALSRLWFILAVATLYVTAQGLEVVETGRRRWVDPHWFRGNSYFRIGWQWVKTALVQGWKLLKTVKFSGNDDPEPAMASKKQHRQRSERIEFKVHTYCYRP